MLHLSQRSSWVTEQPITAMMSEALSRPELVSLAAGFVDQHSLPCPAAAAAAATILGDARTGQAALQYGSTKGHLPLRELVLERLVASDAAAESYRAATPEDLIITAGSNQLLHLVGETLCDPGDIVLCDSPSYFVFKGLLANMGVRSVGVDVDEGGMILESLSERLEQFEARGELGRVKAIYSVSYFDNPRGVSLALNRRPQLVEIARRWSRRTRILVIEDIAYRDLRYEGPDLPSIRSFDEEGDTVLVAGTFSKSFSPGIRVGYGLLPPDLVEPLCQQKGNFDFGSPNFAQHLMHHVLAAGEHDRHVAHLRDVYRRKRDAMLAALQEHFGSTDGIHWIRPSGGLYVWLTLPPAIDTGRSGWLFHAATEAGVLYVPGQYCFPAESVPQRNTIRLSFGVQTPERIEVGISALAAALASGMR